MNLSDKELNFLHMLAQAKRDGDAWQYAPDDLPPNSRTKLDTKRLVVRKQDDQDRRKSVYSITTLGLEIANETVPSDIGEEDDDFDQRHPDPDPHFKSRLVQTVLDQMHDDSADEDSPLPVLMGEGLGVRVKKHNAPDRYPHLAEAARERTNGHEPNPDADPVGAFHETPASADACAPCDHTCPYRAAFDIAAKTMPELHQLRFALQQLRDKRKD